MTLPASGFLGDRTAAGCWAEVTVSAPASEAAGAAASPPPEEAAPPQAAAPKPHRVSAVTADRRLRRVVTIDVPSPAWSALQPTWVESVIRPLYPKRHHAGSD